MHPLINVRAKIRRSIDHLETLDGEITRFLGSNPYELVSNFDAQKRIYSYRVNIRKEVPIFIRILAGEVINHLRSALDHLAWQLALLRVQEPRKKTMFPISINSKFYGDNRDANIGDLSADAQAIVDELQPYRSPKPEENQLWVLDRLANSDKHRLLTVVGAMPTTFDVERRGRDIRIGMRLGPFDTQTEIGSIEFLNPAETDVEVKLSCTFDLAFSVEAGTQIRLIRPTLVNFGKAVEAIAKRFDGFFPPI